MPVSKSQNAFVEDHVRYNRGPDTYLGVPIFAQQDSLPTTELDTIESNLGRFLDRHPLPDGLRAWLECPQPPSDMAMIAFHGISNKDSDSAKRSDVYKRLVRYLEKIDPANDCLSKGINREVVGGRFNQSLRYFRADMDAVISRIGYDDSARLSALRKASRELVAGGPDAVGSFEHLGMVAARIAAHIQV